MSWEGLSLQLCEGDHQHPQRSGHWRELKGQQERAFQLDWGPGRPDGPNQGEAASVL